MSNQNEKLKSRRTTIFSYFSKQAHSESSNVHNQPCSSSVMDNPHCDEQPPPSNRQRVESSTPCQRPRVQSVEVDTNNVQRDPGKRGAILTYPVNDRDNIRRIYIHHEPYQPKLDVYPSTLDGDQIRRFQYNWFAKFNWLEYSVEKDKAYCFPCFVFDKHPPRHPVFTVEGFNFWKRVGGTKGCCFRAHVGLSNSSHNTSMIDWYNLQHSVGHIPRAMNPQSAEDVRKNRMRLNATILAIRLLGKQALAFRGDDESISSSNRGNFVELLKAYGEVNKEVTKVTLEEAPRNAKYISPMIQKEILNIIANRVRSTIRDEIGDAKFCILVDEALDESSREQMAIILRFVDCHGVVRERYFEIVSVEYTCALTLKEKIDKVLSLYNLQVSNMRGQGYDGASNMRGQWNGLQALFLQDCPYAYYVHCFAHRLQLCLNAAAKDVHDIYLFFQMLTNIVNLVTSSSKRVSELRCAREVEVLEQLATGDLETGTGANQMCTLQRAGATRWSSHFASIRRLIVLFKATCTVLQNMSRHGLNNKIRGEAKGSYKALMSFEFVFNLHLLDKVMGITNVLCKQLQLQSQDIINAMNLVLSTKSLLLKLRQDGWDAFMRSVISFCEKEGIDIPNLDDGHWEGTGRSCQQQNSITVEHYFRVDIFNSVIDYQLTELDSRFGERAMELLTLSSALDPRDGFRSFDIEKICSLAEKFYPGDIKDYEICFLREQLQHFEFEFSTLHQFKNMSSLSELCQEIVRTRKTFPLIERLIRLVFTLPVSTATTERAFSAMKIIKNRLRNKIEDDFLGDCMIVHIERELVDNIDVDSIIDEFNSLKTRRVQLR